MTTAVFPTSLTRGENREIMVEWSDGVRMTYSARQLRDHCPCATCREKSQAPPQPKSSLPILSMEEARPLEVASMRPVGSYAYAILFSDGHSNGIFTFELLRALGREPG